GLHAPNGACHAHKRVAVALNSAARSDERRIDRRSSRAARVEDVAHAQLKGHGWVGFEKLHHIELPLAQRFEVGGHGLIGRAIEAGWVDASLTQVMLQAHPRRGYFGNSRKSQ